MEHAIVDTGIKPVIIEHLLQWHNATKTFDKNKSVPADKFELLKKHLVALFEKSIKLFHIFIQAMRSRFGITVVF